MRGHPPVIERLSNKEIRALNRYYETLGLRVCRVCQGKPLPLDAEHFKRHSRGRMGFEHVCLPCWKAANNAGLRRRYATDAEYRKRCKEKKQTDFARYPAARRAAHTRRQQTYMLRRKRARFARILGVKAA